MISQVKALFDRANGMDMGYVAFAVILSTVLMYALLARWQMGMPELSHFIAVAPFAVLAVAMRSPDFMGAPCFSGVELPGKGQQGIDECR